MLLYTLVFLLVVILIVVGVIIWKKPASPSAASPSAASSSAVSAASPSAMSGSKLISSGNKASGASISAIPTPQKRRPSNIAVKPVDVILDNNFNTILISKDSYSIYIKDPEITNLNIHKTVSNYYLSIVNKKNENYVYNGSELIKININDIELNNRELINCDNFSKKLIQAQGSGSLNQVSSLYGSASASASLGAASLGAASLGAASSGAASSGAASSGAASSGAAAGPVAGGGYRTKSVYYITNTIFEDSYIKENSAVIMPVPLLVGSSITIYKASNPNPLIYIISSINVTSTVQITVSYPDNLPYYGIIIYDPIQDTIDINFRGTNN
jgi:hypothetical protein